MSLTHKEVFERYLYAGPIRLWTARPELAPTTRPDLSTIRQELDQLTTQILHQLQSTLDIRRPTLSCRVRCSTGPTSTRWCTG
jgi:chorismate mutase